MLNEDDNYKVESVVEQLIFMLWLSVGIIAVIVPILALAL
jgi:hypothetical protein